MAQSQRDSGTLLVGVVARADRFRKLAERGLLPLAARDGISFFWLDVAAPAAALGPLDAVLLKVWGAGGRHMLNALPLRPTN